MGGVRNLGTEKSDDLTGKTKFYITVDLGL